MQNAHTHTHIHYTHTHTHTHIHTHTCTHAHTRAHTHTHARARDRYHALNSQAIASKVPIQSYWTFSDIFEEGGQQPYEFGQAFGTRTFNGVPKPVYRSMQLLKRLGGVSFPVLEQRCTGAGFNCTANLTVTAVDATATATVASAPLPAALHMGPANASESPRYEALLVNHPTGVVDMRFSPQLPSVTVTVTFKHWSVSCYIMICPCVGCICTNFGMLSDRIPCSSLRFLFCCCNQSARLGADFLAGAERTCFISSLHAVMAVVRDIAPPIGGTSPDVKAVYVARLYIADR
jgi:hypothetical protein